MLDFLKFILDNTAMSVERQVELKIAYSKQVGWTAMVKDKEGEEVENPVSFKEKINTGIWEYIRGECAAGKQKLRKEAREIGDSYSDIMD